MTDEQYATPIIIDEDGQSSLLERIPVSGKSSNRESVPNPRDSC